MDPLQWMQERPKLFPAPGVSGHRCVALVVPPGVSAVSFVSSQVSVLWTLRWWGPYGTPVGVSETNEVRTRGCAPLL